MPDYEAMILERQDLLDALLDQCDYQCEKCPIAEWDEDWEEYICAAYLGPEE